MNGAAMPLPFALRIDTAASSTLAPIFDIIEKPADGHPETRDNALAALVLVAREMGRYEGATQTHLLHRTEIQPSRIKSEEHIPTKLYPANLRDSQRTLENKIKPLIGEAATGMVIANLRAYADQQIQEAQGFLRGSD
jgi:hypothetical protein